MMRRAFVLGLFLLCASRLEAACAGSSPNWTAATWADVQACLDGAGFRAGDTITITADVTATSALSWTKKATIKGSACTLGTVNGIANVPTSCPIQITDGTADGTYLMKITLASGGTTILRDLEFIGGKSTNYADAIAVQGCNDGRTFRGTNLIFNGMRRGAFQPNGARGVVDHTKFIVTDVGGGAASWGVVMGHVYDMYYSNCAGINNYGDLSTAAGPSFGRESDSMYFEDVVLDNLSRTRVAAIDCQYGGRYVLRFSYYDNASLECHGLEAERYQSSRAIEVYFLMLAGTDAVSTPTYYRGGTGMIHNNTMTGWTAGANLGLINNLLLEHGNYPFGGADGRNVWDQNAAGTPFAAGTCNKVGTLSCTVSGTPYTAHQWIGYTIRRTSGVAVSSMTRSGSTVTVNTSNAHGFSTGNPVSCWGANQYGYNGIFRVTVTDSDTFTFSTFYNVPTPATGTIKCAKGNNFASIDDNTTSQITFSDAPTEVLVAGTRLAFQAGDTFEITKVTFSHGQVGVSRGTSFAGVDYPSRPGGWNDQVIEPFREWLNVREMGNYVHFSNGRAGSCNGTCTFYTIVENTHFYNYTTSFNGTVGVGSGSRASRPATCTTGVAYWSTDQGGNWDTIHGGANDGTLDLCTATNTWTNNWYTPATYPHSLNDGAGGGGR